MGLRSKRYAVSTLVFLALSHLFQMSAKYTTEVVSNCIYGIDSKSLVNEKSVLLAMGSSVLDSSSSMLIYTMLTTFFPIIKRFWKKAFVPKKAENFFINLTMESVRMRDEGNNQRDDFMNYVLNLRNKKNLSDVDIAAHAITFFLDGFETSSVALCFTMYYLGKNKQIQDKLRKEIMNSVGDDDGRLSFEKITDLPYLEQVLNGKCGLKSVVCSVYFNRQRLYSSQRVYESSHRWDSLPEYARIQLH